MEFYRIIFIHCDDMACQKISIYFAFTLIESSKVAKLIPKLEI